MTLTPHCTRMIRKHRRGQSYYIFLKNAIDKSSLGLKSLPKIARQTLRDRHPTNNPNGRT